MNFKRYKYSVSSTVNNELSNIKKDKEIVDELSDKLFLFVYTYIGTQVTANGASVGSYK